MSFPKRPKRPLHILEEWAAGEPEDTPQGELNQALAAIVVALCEQVTTQDSEMRRLRSLLESLK